MACLETRKIRFVHRRFEGAGHGGGQGIDSTQTCCCCSFSLSLSRGIFPNISAVVFEKRFLTLCRFSVLRSPGPPVESSILKKTAREKAQPLGGPPDRFSDRGAWVGGKARRSVRRKETHRAASLGLGHSASPVDPLRTEGGHRDPLSSEKGANLVVVDRFLASWARSRPPISQPQRKNGLYFLAHQREADGGRVKERVATRSSYQRASRLARFDRRGPERAPLAALGSLSFLWMHSDDESKWATDARSFSRF